MTPSFRPVRNIISQILLSSVMLMAGWNSAVASAKVAQQYPGPREEGTKVALGLLGVGVLLAILGGWADLKYTGGRWGKAAIVIVIVLGALAINLAVIGLGDTL